MCTWPIDSRASLNGTRSCNRADCPYCRPGGRFTKPDYLQNEGRNQNTLSVSVETYEKLEAHAKRVGTPVAQIVTEWIHDACDRDEPVRPFKPDRIQVNRGNWRRAGGDSVCAGCACVYYDHATVRGFTWLRRLCNGDLVKL